MTGLWCFFKAFVMIFEFNEPTTTPLADLNFDIFLSVIPNPITQFLPLAKFFFLIYLSE